MDVGKNITWKRKRGSNIINNNKAVGKNIKWGRGGTEGYYEEEKIKKVLNNRGGEE